MFIKIRIKMDNDPLCCQELSYTSIKQKHRYTTYGYPLNKTRRWMSIQKPNFLSFQAFVQISATHAFVLNMNVYCHCYLCLLRQHWRLIIHLLSKNTFSWLVYDLDKYVIAWSSHCANMVLFPKMYKNFHCVKMTWSSM